MLKKIIIFLRLINNMQKNVLIKHHKNFKVNYVNRHLKIFVLVDLKIDNNGVQKYQMIIIQWYMYGLMHYWVIYKMNNNIIICM